MSKPRTLVSSTYFDFKDVRESVRGFLEGIGHEPLLHELPTFGVTPGRHSHRACLDQVNNADFLILIIGGRRGGTYVASEKSITNEEYRAAIKRKIPVITFVSKDVETASQFFKKNPNADLSQFVDDVRVFDFLDLVKAQSEDNWVRTFVHGGDIVDGLRGQFAYIHLVFSQQFVRERTSPAKGKRSHLRDYDVVSFPSDFSAFTDVLENEVASAHIEGLHSLHRIIKSMHESRATGYEEKLKVLWVMGRYGDHEPGDPMLRMPGARFKQYAWSTTKGRRVFSQMEDFGIRGWYTEPEDGSDLGVRLSFSKDKDGLVAQALKYFVLDLLAKYGEDDGLEFLQRADMRLYSSGQNTADLPSVTALSPKPAPKKAKARLSAGKLK